MRKEEILILDIEDLNVSGQELWDQDQPINFNYHLKPHIYQPLIKNPIVLLEKKNGAMSIIKNRYLIEIP